MGLARDALLRPPPLGLFFVASEAKQSRAAKYEECCDITMTPESSKNVLREYPASRYRPN
jgi:hypothetical protein